MAAAALDDHRHYMRLPMCGYCMNAWDMIYMRLRPGTTSPARWIEFCHVGGCDPDVWDFIDEGTGWPNGFVLNDHGVDWMETVERYQPPDHDNTVFHRRLSDGDGARWRKVMPKLVDAWHATRKEKEDSNGALKDELIDWGEVEFEEEETTDEVEVIPDEEIEW
jgi:hypothetical protein